MGPWRSLSMMSLYSLLVHVSPSCLGRGSICRCSLPPWFGGGRRIYPPLPPVLSHLVRYACILSQYSFPDLALGAHRHVGTYLRWAMLISYGVWQWWDRHPPLSHLIGGAGNSCCCIPPTYYCTIGLALLVPSWRIQCVSKLNNYLQVLIYMTWLYLHLPLESMPLSGVRFQWLSPIPLLLLFLVNVRTHHFLLFRCGELSPHQASCCKSPNSAEATHDPP